MRNMNQNTREKHICIWGAENGGFSTKSFPFSHFSLHLSGIESITFASVALGKPGTSELDANTKHYSLIQCMGRLSSVEHYAPFSGHSLSWIKWERRPVLAAIREWSVFSTLPLTTWKWLWKFHVLPMDFYFLCIREHLLSQAFDSALEIFERKGFESKAFWNAKHCFYYQLKTGPLTSRRYISLLLLWFLPRWLVMPFLFWLLQLYLTMRCIIQMPSHSSYC